MLSSKESRLDLKQQHVHYFNQYQGDAAEWQPGGIRPPGGPSL
jgi:hypothetical protein